MINDRGVVLAVDDEPGTLRLLEEAMLANGYEVMLAADGVEGWEVMQTAHSDIDAILLDRIMPRMDGMELLEKIKAHPDMNAIPVIMETSAMAEDEIIEGIEAGAYYYLTKPFHIDVLTSIVNTAVQDYRNLKNLLAELGSYRKMLGLIRDSHFEFRSLREAQDLAVFLAAFYPDPERVVLGLSELLINAVEHGNLGIGYARKTKLVAEARWSEEIEHLLNLPENAEKKAHVRYERLDHEIRLYIQDEGEGFNWKPYMKMDPCRVTDNHGRGIAFANMSSFDDIEYLDCGNRVLCVVRLGPDS